MKQLNLFRFAFASAALFALSACAPSISPPTGKEVTVQVRRDALGAASELPIGPLSGSVNGAVVHVNGLLKNVNGEWIVIETAAETEVWFARSSVLLIEYKKQ